MNKLADLPALGGDEIEKLAVVEYDDATHTAFWAQRKVPRQGPVIECDLLQRLGIQTVGTTLNPHPMRAVLIVSNVKSATFPITASAHLALR